MQKSRKFMKGHKRFSVLSFLGILLNKTLVVGEEKKMKKREVLTSIKDEKLIVERRNQMIKGAVTLFKEKGFHRTTTREIAKAAGFSIGTLYEYIRTKEDVLYLVCDSIYDHVSERLQQDLSLKNGTLAEVLVMYQEVKSLSKDALPYVLKKEMEMVAMFENLLTRCVENGELE